MSDNDKLKIIGDLGNSLIKMIFVFPDGSREELVFPHAVVPISQENFQNIKDKFGASEFGEPSYFELDGQPYVVGELAEQYGMVDRRSSNVKYTRDYYGVLFVEGLMRVIPEGHDNIEAFVCHPALDQGYRKNQMKALKGEFKVSTSGKNNVKYHVRYINTYLEPVGGLMNIVLDDTGRVDNSVEDDGRVLIFDVGGRITNVVPFNNLTGEIEYDNARSAPVGILNVLEDLEQGLRTRYEDRFSKTRIIPMDRLRNALRTGYYRGGGDQIPCEDEIDRAMNILLSRLHSIYFEHAGGPQVYDSIYITGGGGGAAERVMREKFLDHKRVFLAETPDEMHMANVRGGDKLLTMLENLNDMK